MKMRRLVEFNDEVVVCLDGGNLNVSVLDVASMEVVTSSLRFHHAKRGYS